MLTAFLFAVGFVFLIKGADFLVTGASAFATRLGVSAVMSPLPFSRTLTFDVVVAIVATLILFMALFVGKRHTLERWQGVVLVAAYVAYVTVLVVRG